ncbi:DUF445 domain-containing protein [Desulfovirgula thermocuniculi]|uniref:DUF445 domain-containing protein n=1 Tax=Desulfovirgula thermocuniculi TaxID=348842 RepID=UPI001B7FE181|nr:DUF445 family protein [Desulfovirgula thermocuniculi]
MRWEQLHWGQAVLMPVTGAFIGWLTNWMAVRLIFRPHRPVRVLGYTIQGVVPRRRHEIARLIGRVVEEELLPKKHLLGSLMTEKMTAEIVRSVEEAVRLRVMDKLPAWLPFNLRRAAADLLAEQVKKELPLLVRQLWGRLEEEVDLSLAALVEERINGFSLEQVEKIITAVAARELKHIEYLGGVLGFIIGLLQLGVLWFARYGGHL